MDLVCGMKQGVIFLAAYLALLWSEVDGRTIRRSSASRSSGGLRFNFNSRRTITSRYGSSYVSSNVRSPHRASTYISTVPSTRYSRSYTSARIGAIYWGYYPSYGIYARSSSYRSRSRPSSEDSVCVNYEANDENTTLGIFTCPLLDNEPDSYTQCCGENYAEFCCEAYGQEDNTTGAIVLLIMIGIIIFVVAVVIIHSQKRKAARRRQINDTNAAQYPGKVMGPTASRPMNGGMGNYNNGHYPMSQPNTRGPPPPPYPPAGGQVYSTYGAQQQHQHQQQQQQLPPLSSYPPAGPMPNKGYPPDTAPPPYPPAAGAESGPMQPAAAPPPAGFIYNDGPPPSYSAP